MVIPLACCAWFVAQCFWCIGSQSLTYDEPVHVIAGLEAWDRGTFDRWNDQPPLGRLLLTAPIHFLGRTAWRLDDLGPSGANFWTISIRPDPIRLAWQTRPVNIALGLVLAALLWVTARRLFSEGAANLALALYACSPALVAHFSLATVDGSATLFFFASVLTVARWRTTPTWLWTFGVGLTLGAFLVSKFSAPPLVLLALIVMSLSARQLNRAERGTKICVAATLAFFVVWSAYRWHVGPVTFRNGSLSGPYARGQNVIVPIARPFTYTVSLPAPEFVAGVGGVLQHSVRGQPTFLLGEVKKSGGWHRYFPVVVLLKWPLTVWLLAGAALTFFVVGRFSPPGEFTVMMLVPVVFFTLALLTNANLGDRYVLPVYPFLLLLASAAWDVASHRRAATALVAAAVMCQAGDALRYAPDYLSYFNFFVPADQSYTWLSDSNLDWGQSLLALRDYERKNPGPIWLAYFGGVDPASYGIQRRILGEHDRVQGTVAVSATHLSGQYLENPKAYHWLLQYPRKAILNHTLYVFEVP